MPNIGNPEGEPKVISSREGVVEYLRNSLLDEELIEGWLAGRSRYFTTTSSENGLRTPDEIISEGRFEEVISAADAYVDGTPASTYHERRSGVNKLPDNVLPFKKPLR